MEYKVQNQLKPSNLKNITDEQKNDQWQLYQGYVNQVNKLNDELSQLTKENKSNTLIYNDRRRRYGFEYNGMVLHEYYFGNITSQETKLEDNPKLQLAITKQWGSFNIWLNDFINTGKTRGIGWAILYLDLSTGTLTNNFVSEHQNGNISGFIPLLVMDVWEHAYMVDHRAGGRGDYIKAFVQNINWNKVENRFKNAIENKIEKRF